MIGPDTASANTRLSQIETAAVTATAITLASPILSSARVLGVTSPPTMTAVPHVTIGTVASRRWCSDTRAASGSDTSGSLSPMSLSTGRIANSSPTYRSTQDEMYCR